MSSVVQAVRPRKAGVSAAPLLFGAAAFASAGLLFLLEPMAAKMVLPRLGGAPAVWNTSMLFFQAVLLCGYLYAHLSAAWLSPRLQTLVHAALLGAAFVLLPPALPPAAGLDLTAHPALGVLRLLAGGVGLPFFTISATAPLLQRWFASLAHPSADDPYFLYAASNAGSFIGLLSYPFLVEPAWTLGQQSRLWSLVFALLVLLLASCMVAVWKWPCSADAPSRSVENGEPLSWRRQLHWVMLAFVPSSLTLGVTTYVTTDVASVPLLWVVPLGLYLLSFTLAFSRKRPVSLGRLAYAMPWVLLALLVNVLLGFPSKIWVSAPLHFVGLLVAGLFCHYRLADDRPSARHLTHFYFWLALGGVLGGVFNAILAPLVFTNVIEYPLVLAMVGFFQLRSVGRLKNASVLVGVPVLSAAVVSVLVLLVGPPPNFHWQAALALLSLLTVTWLGFARMPWLFGATAVGTVAVFASIAPADNRVMAADRSFFGVYRVLESEGGRFHLLSHGTTIHGREDWTLPNCQPLSYFSRSGPVGEIFSLMKERDASPRRVAVVGLGAGSLACYSEPGQHWTFFEIDPVVERIARDQRYFRFLARAASEIEIVQGDGRLSLQNRAETYDVLIQDAFSSDAVPVHLLTTEALALYRERLRKGGLLLLNISNRHLNLEPVVAALAARTGLVAFARHDTLLTTSRRAAGEAPSEWVALGESPGTIGVLAGASNWARLHGSTESPCWTDEFSNIVMALRK